MTSDRRRATVFIASGFGVAAAVGAGVWWASSPATNNVASTSTETSVSTPADTSSNGTSTSANSSTNTHSAHEAASGDPNKALPSQTLSREHPAAPTHVAPPRADDPFLPPNALLAAPQPIERETMVYRPSNIVPTPAGTGAQDTAATVSAATPEDTANTTATGTEAPNPTEPQTGDPASTTATSGTRGEPGNEAPSNTTSAPTPLPEIAPDGTPAVPGLGEILPEPQVPSLPTTVAVPEAPQLPEAPANQEAPEAPAPQPEPEVRPETQQGATPGSAAGSDHSSTPWWKSWRDRIFG